MKVGIIFREHIEEPLKKHIHDADSITIGNKAILIRNVDGSHKSYDRYYDSFIQIKMVKNTGD